MLHTSVPTEPYSIFFLQTTALKKKEEKKKSELVMTWPPSTNMFEYCQFEFW